MKSEEPRNVIVCPLGWGLGHASRDIPIIEQLVIRGHHVYIAADKPQLDYLRQYFPSLDTIVFPSPKVRFGSGNTQFLPLFWFALRLPFFICWEHYRLNRLIRRYSIDLVISDNRYGLWSRFVESIIITHQLRIIPPFPFRWAMPAVEFLLKRWLKRFDKVLIPDFNDERSIAGLLSKANGLNNLNYIGLLSRFSNIKADSLFACYELIVIASGPEPQRSIFVGIAKKLAVRHQLNCLIVEGKLNNGINPRSEDGVWSVGHLPDSQFAAAVKQAKYLLIRGGYSTIMDMLVLGVSGLIVPTPGQTEQEYLAKRLSDEHLFRYVTQSGLLYVDTINLQAKELISEKSIESFTFLNQSLLKP